MPISTSTGAHGRGLQPATTCKNVLKAVALPVLAFVGPIIALLGLVISSIVNFARFEKVKYDYKKKNVIRMQVLSQLSPEESAQLNKETFKMKKVMDVQKARITKDALTWAKRIIPAYYAGEVLGDLLSSKSEIPLFSTIPTLSEVSLESLESLSHTDPGLSKELSLLITQTQDLLSDAEQLSSEEVADLNVAFSLADRQLSLGELQELKTTVARLRNLVGVLHPEQKNTAQGLLSLSAHRGLERFFAENPLSKNGIDKSLIAAKALLLEKADLSDEVVFSLQKAIQELEASLLKDRLINEAADNLEEAVQLGAKEADARTKPFSVQGEQAWNKWCLDQNNDLELLNAKEIVQEVVYCLSSDSGTPALFKGILRLHMTNFEKAIIHNTPLTSHLTSLKNAIGTIHQKQAFPAERLLSKKGLKELRELSSEEQDLRDVIEKSLQQAGALLLKKSGVSSLDKSFIKDAIAKVDEGLLEHEVAQFFSTEDTMLWKSIKELQRQVKKTPVLPPSLRPPFLDL